MLFIVAMGLLCCMRAFSSHGEQGLLLAAVPWLLIAVASLVAEHRLQGAQASADAACGLSSSEACGIFLDQGLNPGFPH